MWETSEEFLSWKLPNHRDKLFQNLTNQDIAQGTAPFD